MKVPGVEQLLLSNNSAGVAASLPSRARSASRRVAAAQARACLRTAISRRASLQRGGRHPCDFSST